MDISCDREQQHLPDVGTPNGIKFSVQQKKAASETRFAKHSKLAHETRAIRNKTQRYDGPSGLRVTHSYSTLYELVVRNMIPRKISQKCVKTALQVNITTICIFRHRALPGSMVRLRRG